MTLYNGLELCSPQISCFHAFWCFPRPILAIVLTLQISVVAIKNSFYLLHACVHVRLPSYNMLGMHAQDYKRAEFKRVKYWTASILLHRY